MAKNFDHSSPRRAPRKNSRKNSGMKADGARDSAKSRADAGNSHDPSNDTRSLSNRGDASKSSSEWIHQIGAQSQSLEQAVHEIILARPLVTAAVAVGAGLVANFLWRSYGQHSGQRFGSSKSSTSSRSGRSARKHVSTGTLSKNISSSLSRMELEFNSLAFGQFDEMRDGLSRLVVDDLKRRPFETLATAAGIGFGLANFDRRHLKQAGLKMLKLAAVRALDSSGVRSESSRPNQPESKTGGTLYV